MQVKNLKWCGLILALMMLLEQASFGLAVQSESLWNGLRDTSGQPLSGGKVYTFDAGTTNLRSTWTTAGKASTNANPIILSAYGQATAFFEGRYKIIIKDSADVTLLTLDNLSYYDPSTVATNTTFVNFTATQGTIGSFTTTGGTISSSTISASTITGGNINGALLTNVTLASSTIDSLGLGLNSDFSSETDFSAVTLVTVSNASTTFFSHAVTNASSAARTYLYTYQFYVLPAVSEAVHCYVSDGTNHYARTYVATGTHAVSMTAMFTVAAGSTKTIALVGMAQTTTADISYFPAMVKKGFSW